MRDCQEVRGKRIVRILDGTINKSVAVVLIFMLLFGVYALWDSHMVYQEADASQYKAYKPTTDTSPSFDELRAINPDVFAWLTIYGTHIDYPVVQGADDTKYLNTNAKGDYAISGAIFLDGKNHRDFSDFNSVIYGHHMEKNEMFGQISDFEEQAFFDAHPYGNLFVNGRNYGVQIFAFDTVDAYNTNVYDVGLTEPSAKEAYLNSILSGAKIKREVGVTTADHLLLMSTCSEDVTNGRYILVARITDQTYPDTFGGSSDNTGNGADAIRGWLMRIPWQGWAFIWLILLFILLWIIKRYREKRKKKQTNRQEK